MERPPSSLPIRIVSAVALAALWAAAVSVLEALFLERWYQLGMRPALSFLELGVNYAVYAAVGTLVLMIVLGALALLARGGRIPFARQILRWDPIRLSGALVSLAVGLFVVARLALQYSLPGTSTWALSRILLLCVLAIPLTALIIVSQRRRSTLGRLVILALLLWTAGAWVWETGTQQFGRLARGAAPGEARRPNVLLVLTDTCRADFLSTYGYDLETSPHVDALARRGLQFDHARGQAAWTLPSTATLLTGLFPSSHGAVMTTATIDPQARLLPETLRDAGYRTAAFTENHYITPRFGFGRGFDEFHAAADPWVYGTTLLYRVQDRLGLPTIHLTTKTDYPREATQPEHVNWDAKRTSRGVIDWLDGIGDSPFFLYVHFMGPHGPYGPREFLLDTEPPSARLVHPPENKTCGYPLGEAAEVASAEYMRDMHLCYAADIRYVDEAFGEMLRWLEDEGRLENTLVVFVGDHGEEFYEHKGWGHGGSAFEEMIRVPLLMAGPGIPETGDRIAEPVGLIDVMPTILEMVDLGAPAELQGRSLTPIWTGEERAALPIYVEAKSATMHPFGCEITALVKDDWKLVRLRLKDDTRSLLYDLASDPEEQIDMADLEPARLDSLTLEMELWDRVARSREGGSRQIRLDPETHEALRALGYVD